MSGGMAEFDRVFRAAVADGLSAAATALADGMRKVQSRVGRFASSMPGSPPNVRRGRLRASFSSTRASPGELVAFAGTNVMYGLYQELGATIRASGGKYLPVPISLKAKRMMETKPKGVSLRTAWPQLVAVTSRRNNKLLVQPKRGGAFDVHFVLKKQIVLPPRPWAAPSIRRSRRDMDSSFKDAARATFVREAA